MQDNPNPVWTLGSSVELAGGKGSGGHPGTEHPHRTYSAQPRRTQHLTSTYYCNRCGSKSVLFAKFGFLPAAGRLLPRCFLIGVESVSGGFPVALQPHQLVLICSSLCNPCATRSSSSLFFIHLQVTAAQLRHRSPYNHSRKVSKMEHRHYEVCRTSLDCTQRR